MSGRTGGNPATIIQETKMALTKEFEYDCEVRGEHKNVQVRKATIVKDDGVENSYPLEISNALIGSCTNSSY